MNAKTLLFIRKTLGLAAYTAAVQTEQQRVQSERDRVEAVREQRRRAYDAATGKTQRIR